jgi:hypothetical protein
MGKVSDLERLGKEAASPEIDKSMRSKIELTMAKPAETPSLEEVPKTQIDQGVEINTVPEDVHDGTSVAEETIVAQIEVVTAADEPIAAGIPIPIVEVEPQTVQETVSSDVLIPVVEEVTVVSVDPIVSEPRAEPDAVVEPLPEPQPIAVGEEQADIAAEEYIDPRETTIPLTTYAMIGGGTALYAIDIYLSISNAIGKVLGWAVIIVASAFLALGVMRLLPKFLASEEGEEEVFLCPKCHEIVSETAPYCPSCGASFKFISSRK